MMGTIPEQQDANRASYARFAREHAQPFVAWPEDVGVSGIVQYFPILEGFTPTGWEKTWVVNVGNIADGAMVVMTPEHFEQAIQSGRGYAVIGEYSNGTKVIAEFERKS